MCNSFVKGEIPLGFGMALAQNTEALNRFALFSDIERQKLIDGARNVRSKQGMREYVNRIIKM